MGNFIAKCLKPKSAPFPQPAELAISSKSARRRTARARRRLPPPSAAQTDLPDEIWAEILLRLDAAADLARASAACSSFRRIVSDPWFLRRFRSLRSPPVLGFICRDKYEFVPIDPSHRSALESRALEQAADFTFPFLPEPDPWDLCNASDGRVLLCRRIAPGIPFDDFLVCDPLHRRYVRIPRIPDDLMASAPRIGHLLPVHFFPVLLPACENDEDGSFRVICTVQRKDKVMAFVFSSCSQTWRGILSSINLPNGFKFTQYRSSYAYSCLYWMLNGIGYSLKLDTSAMEFSVIGLPPHNFDSERAIVEAGEGTLRLLVIADDTIDLYYCKNWQRNGVGAQEWQHDKRIPLPKDSRNEYIWTIVGTEGHCLALLGSREISDELEKCEYFLLDTKTLLLEKVCTLSNVDRHGVLYASFPPPFALPNI